MFRFTQGSSITFLTKSFLSFATLGSCLLFSACEQAVQNTELPVNSEVKPDAVTATPVSGGLVDPKRVDAALKALVDSGELVGVSALVYEKGREVYFGTHGYADRESKKPLARDTIVRIFSMTKPITGVTLMTLYDEGKFKVSDPLVKYIPEFADLKVVSHTDENGEPVYEELKGPIEVGDILRHTAGFTSLQEDSFASDRWREIKPDDWSNTLTQMVEKMGQVPLLFQPGERWLYGPSVDVQALLAERLAGIPYKQLVRERVLSPLGMKDTYYLLPEAKRERLAALYRRQDDGRMEPIGDDEANARYVKDWPLTLGGWGLVSTLDDYMRFALMLQNGGELDGVRVIKSETIDKMATDSMPNSVRDVSWLPNKGQVGFGIDFAVRIAEPATAEEASGEVGEFFWDGAANTLFFVDPVNDITAVLFVQYLPFGGVPVHKNFRDAIYFHDEDAYSGNAAALKAVE